MAVDIFIGLIGFVVGWRHTLPVIGGVHARVSAGVFPAEASPLEIESETK